MPASVGVAGDVDHLESATKISQVDVVAGKVAAEGGTGCVEGADRYGGEREQGELRSPGIPVCGCICRVPEGGGREVLGEGAGESGARNQAE